MPRNEAGADGGSPSFLVRGNVPSMRTDEATSQQTNQPSERAIPRKPEAKVRIRRMVTTQRFRQEVPYGGSARERAEEEIEEEHLFTYVESLRRSRAHHRLFVNKDASHDQVGASEPASTIGTWQQLIRKLVTGYLSRPRTKIANFFYYEERDKPSVARGSVGGNSDGYRP